VEDRVAAAREARTFARFQKEFVPALRTGARE
jgi:hypothetical protein